MLLHVYVSVCVCVCVCIERPIYICEIHGMWRLDNVCPAGESMHHSDKIICVDCDGVKTEVHLRKMLELPPFNAIGSAFLQRYDTPLQGLLATFVTLLLNTRNYVLEALMSIHLTN